MGTPVVRLCATISKNSVKPSISVFFSCDCGYDNCLVSAANFVFFLFFFFWWRRHFQIFWIGSAQKKNVREQVFCFCDDGHRTLTFLTSSHLFFLALSNAPPSDRHPRCNFRHCAAQARGRLVPPFNNLRDEAHFEPALHGTRRDRAALCAFFGQLRVQALAAPRAAARVGRS